MIFRYCNVLTVMVYYYIQARWKFLLYLGAKSMKKSVLIVDDNEMHLNLIKEMLTEQYNIQTVNSAVNALKHLNTNKVDIILLDILMPNIGGFEFLYAIREIPSYMDVPIIIVSGNTGEDYIREAKNSSAFEVLAKPVNQLQLQKTIEKALRSNE